MRIAAVCAPTRGLNTGMLTVDCALLSLIWREDVQRNIAIDLFNVEYGYTVNDLHGAPLLRYEKLESLSQLEGYDRVLYWGDFLTARRYQETGLRSRLRREQGHAFSDDTFNHVAGLLIMEGASDELLNKTICVGGSIYTNNWRDESDKRYNEAIGRFYSQAALVLKRDPISAQFAHRYSARLDCTNGVDCAFFLKPFDRLSWRQGSRAEQSGLRIGYSFGRGLSEAPESSSAMASFVNEIAHKMNATAVVDINWLTPNKGNAAAGVVAKLEAINQCHLVITDTYHCSINSWREGTPAICIGVGAEHPKTALSDKKKEILYTMFNARDYYVFYETIADPGQRRAAADRLVRVLDNPRRTAFTGRQILECSQIAERRVASALGIHSAT